MKNCIGLLAALLAASPGALRAQSIAANPASLSFAYQLGATALPATQNVQVSSSPAGMSFTVSVSGAPANGAWVLTSLSSGKTPQAVKVQVNPTGLPAGTYSAAITLTGTGTPVPTKVIPVTLLVTTAAPTLTANPASLTVTYVTGTPTNAPSLTKVVVIASNGGAVSATLSVTGATWLKASPTGSINLAGLLNTITVVIDPRGLAPKTYSGAIKLAAPNAATKTLDIPVTLIVNAAPPTLSGTWPLGLIQQSPSSILSVTGASLFSTTTATASGFSPNFKVTVTDSTSATATEVFNVPVHAGAAGATRLRINLATPLPAATVGAGYLQNLAAAGGTSPYIWTQPSGTLPPGVTLSAGTLQGVPTSAGTYRFVLAVTDSSSPSALFAYQNFQLTVYPVGTTSLRVTLGAAPLPAAQTSTAYAPPALTAAGGTGPYTWSATGLPAGLSIDASGNISGSPTSAGTTGPLSSTIVSDTAMLVTVPPSYLAAEGVMRLSASTPTPGGGVSNEAQLQVYGPNPQIDVVLNAASYRQGTVAPGEIVTIFGHGLGGAGLTLFDPSAPSIATSLPSAPPSTTVTINGVPAPLLYVTANQIACIVPYATAGPTAQFAVTYNSLSSQAFPVSLAASEPGIFTIAGSGQGQAAALNFDAATQDYTINSETNAALRGSTIVLYVTGAGSMSSPVDNQLIPSSPAVTPTNAPTVTIGGQTSTVAGAAAPAGSVPGLLQVNVTVPANAPAGKAVPVVVNIGGVDSQTAVTVALK